MSQNLSIQMEQDDFINPDPCNFHEGDCHKYEEIELLGTGAFGKVHRCRGHSGEEFAVKKAPIENYRSTLDVLFREVNNWKKIQDKHIVGYHCHWIYGPNAKEIRDGSYIIPQGSSSRPPLPEINFLMIHMECCTLTLSNWLEDYHQQVEMANPRNITDMFIQLTTGVCAIHSKNIIHRDLSPDNIFLKIGPNGSNTWKIGDFGLSREHTEEEKSDYKGNWLYQSPEMCTGDKSYDHKTDVYGLGLIFLTILNPNLQDYRRRVGILVDLREGSRLETALNTATRDIPDIYGLQKAIVLEMLERSPILRLNSFETLQKLKNYTQEAVQALVASMTPPSSYVMSGPFKFQEPSLDFKGREVEILQISEQLSKVENPIKLILITGNPSVGKSELAKNFSKQSKDKHHCVFIDCQDIEKNFKEFCNHHCPESTWIMTFDQIDEKSYAYFELVLTQLKKRARDKRHTIIVIVTSVMSWISSKLPCDLVLSLDYDWIPTYLNDGSGDLGKLMTLALSNKIDSPNTSEETMLICVQSCEAFGFLKSSYEFLNASLGFLILISYFGFDSRHRIPVRAVIQFWSVFVNLDHDNGQKIIANVFEVFLKTGVICMSSLAKKSSHTKMITSLGYDFDNYYIFTVCRRVVTEFVLPHPLLKYIFATILKINLSELSVFKKFLETLKSITTDSAITNYNLRSYMAISLLTKMLKYDELVTQYAKELAEFSNFDQEVPSDQIIKEMYKTYFKKFGEEDENTRMIADELENRYSKKYDFQACLSLTQKRYEYFKQKFGNCDERAFNLGQGVAAYLSYLDRTSEAVDILKEIKYNCEQELGPMDSKTLRVSDQLNLAIKEDEFMKKRVVNK